jgi:hypothetical protein
MKRSISYLSILFISANLFFVAHIHAQKIVPLQKNIDPFIYDTLKWKNIKMLEPVLRKYSIVHSNITFNPDFTKMFASALDPQNKNYEIYSSKLKNGAWEELKKLPIEINTPGYNSTQPAIGFLGDEEVLFFSSDKPGGEGKMDIWYSKINTDESYSKAINAGKKINSPEDEITPFYCKPCQELFFSSNSHKSFGGFDVFKSNYQNNQFQEPKNLGLPFNSNADDNYFSINSDKTSAFLSSDRIDPSSLDKEKNEQRFYMISLRTGNATNEKIDSTTLFINQIKSLLPLTLYFHNDEPDSKTLATTTSKNYKKTYDDYSAMRELYKKEYSRDKKNKDIEISNNQIDGLFNNSVDAGMRDLETFSSLLLKILQKDKKVTITIKSFCSPLAANDYNINLAKRRIASLRNYFMEYKKGVFTKYINTKNTKGASIQFIEEDLGEEKAPGTISDDYYDTKNSIYNPKAALERKIQISSITIISPEKK